MWSWRQLVVLAATGCLTAAEVYFYDDVILEYERLIYRESGLYSPGDTPAKGPPGDGEAFIKLTDLHFSLVQGEDCPTQPQLADGSSSCSTGVVDVVVFERAKFDNLGYTSGDSRYWCCNDDAIADRGCDAEDKGHLILTDPDAALHVRRLNVTLDKGAQLINPSDGLFQIGRKGMYIVMMANCNPATGPLHINGHTEWMNPYGYLPGEWYGCLPFFRWVSGLYLALGVLWTALCMRHTKDLLGLQLWASAVLLLGMVETTAKYFDYREWNSRGIRHSGGLAFGIVFGVSKRALSRVLVLMTCMGYGVVRPSLGQDMYRILLLGLAYFVSSTIYELLANLPATDKVLDRPLFLDGVALLVFVTSIIDVIFYMWTLQSIFGVVGHLRARRQSVKLLLYMRFRMVLLVAVVFSVVWAMYGVIQSSGDRMERDWEQDWTVNAVWEVLYLFLLGGILVLFRPSANAQRYAYSLELGTMDDGDRGRRRQREGDERVLLDEDEEDGEYGGALDDGEDEFIAGANGLNGQVALKKQLD